MRKKVGKRAAAARSRGRKKKTARAPRSTKRASARAAAERETGMCKYEGKDYSEGAVICVGKRAFRCHAGEWIGWGRC